MKRYWARYLCDINDWEKVEINDNRKVILADEVDAEMKEKDRNLKRQDDYIAGMTTEIARLQKGLEFYGDRETYIFNDTLPGKLIDFDNGVYARKILAPEKEKETSKT